MSTIVALRAIYYSYPFLICFVASKSLPIALKQSNGKSFGEGMIKPLVIGVLLISILFIYGCCGLTQKNPVQTNSICGNGVLEEGETSTSCCEDAGCLETFQCISKNDNSNISFCKKIQKADTFESKKIRDTMDTLSKLNYQTFEIDTLRFQVENIKTYSDRLKSKGYDTRTEEFLYQAYGKFLDYAEILKNGSNISSSSERKKFLGIAINGSSVLLNELELLKKENEANMQDAEETYDFKIDNIVLGVRAITDVLESMQKDLNEGYKLKLTLTRKTYPCSQSYSSYYGTQTYSDGKIYEATIFIQNNGKIALLKPKVSLSLYSGNIIFEENKTAPSVYSNQIGSTVKIVFSSSIPTATKLSEGIGIGDWDSLSCNKDYDLVADVFDGDNYIGAYLFGLRP